MLNQINVLEAKIFIPSCKPHLFDVNGQASLLNVQIEGPSQCIIYEHGLFEEWTPFFIGAELDTNALQV